MVSLVKRFLHLEAASGVILFCAAILALLLVNSPWQPLYHAFWNYRYRSGLAI